MNKLLDGFSRNTWWSRLLFCLPLLLASQAYPLANALAAGSGEAIILKLPLDSLIPFTKVFIIPYYYWYLQIFITLAWLIFSRRTGRILHWVVLSLVIADLIAAVFYLIMPTAMVRPAVEGTDLLSSMVRLVYSIDLPFNLFPSSHVIFAVILNRAWSAAGPSQLWFRGFNHAGTILIIASTVLVKQHYTPDILGGLAVAAASLAAGRAAWRWLSIRLIHPDQPIV